MPFYRVDSDFGMTIVEASNIRQAEKFAREEWGRAFVQSVEKATDHDVEWVKKMGGAIHDAREE